MGEQPTVTATSTYVISAVVMPNRWYAYGVLAEDGGLSYQTYKTADEAKRDSLYRGRARIVRLSIELFGHGAHRDFTLDATVA